MKHLAIFAALIVLCCIRAAAQPSIAADGVFNSASYLPSGLPNSGIAQGSIFIIFGSNLGPATIAQAPSYPLSTQLAGTSVKVTVNGASTNALMVYTIAGQVAAILPSSTPVGTGTVTVTYNGQTSASAPITVVANNFGIFALNQGGSGPAVVTTPAYAAVTLTSPAKPGDVLVLWGTGLGAYSGDETNPPAQTDLPISVSVYVGNKPATVSYKGRSSSPGLDQINFTVPAGVSGCYVPVVAVVNGTPSNFTSTSVSAGGGTCSDPAGLPGSAINRVAAGGNLKVGFIELQRIAFNVSVPILGTVNVKQDRGSAYFYNFDNRALIASRGISTISSFSSCSVLVCPGNTCIPNDEALGVPRLAAGSEITITGPNGSAPLALSSVGEYHGLLGPMGLTGSSYLSPGSYTASGSGGVDVGAFMASLTVTEPLTWTNQSSFSNAISRNQDLTINWTGGGANDYVAIVGSSTSAVAQVTTTFVCSEKASAGSFTVPAYALSAMPSSGTILLSGMRIPAGFLLVGNYPLSSTFSAPGLDVGFFTHTIVNGINLPYR